MQVKRFGVSLEEDLLEALDSFVSNHRFPNRSQALRFLIKKHIVEKKWEGNEDVAGAIVLVYDHTKRDLHAKMTRLQHEYQCLVLSSQHLHLDHNNCLETIAVRGKADKLLKLADKLKALKGITHGELIMTGAG